MSSERVGAGETLSPVRPEAREGQVLDIAEIVPGAVFSRFNGNKESKASYTVLGLPQERERGSYWVRCRVVLGGVKYPGGEYILEYDISLADSGVVPYFDEKGNAIGWNPTNYLVKKTSVSQDKTP